MTFVQPVLALSALLACLQTALAAQSEDRPNFVLFIADDVSWNDFGCYGNDAARTPNVDRLAAEGLKFTEAYLTASSCSPSRASIITGRYPHNNGPASELHLAIPGHLPWFPALLREHGYYTALSGKNHMKAETADGSEPAQAFDHIDGGRRPGNSGGHANWTDVVENRPSEQPFCFWFAAYDAHRAWDGDKQWDAERYGPMHDPQSVVVPPFLGDDEQTRQDLASYYNEVTRFDYYIGEVVEQLRESGDLDNTLIFVLADNGRPFPRAKTRLHDSGMKTALVAHWPKGIDSSTSCDSLVSVIDLAPTILRAAGLEVPETIQGVSLLPLFEDPDRQVRRYAFSEHNWHDYEAHGRAVRDGRFLFIRNFRPQYPWQGPADSVRSPSHQRLRERRDAGELTAAQRDVFLAPRPEVALYDTQADPHQLHNLAGLPDYADRQQELSSVLKQWMEETADSVPDDISRDSFDRETGERVVQGDEYRGTPPGSDRNAAHVNAAGPR